MIELSVLIIEMGYLMNMKKFYLWYICVFLFIILILFFARNYIDEFFSKSIFTLSADQIIDLEDINNKSNNSLNSKKAGEVGKINYNYASDYKNVSKDFSKYDSNSKLYTENIEEVQFYRIGGYGNRFTDNKSYLDSVYYYSRELDDIKKLLNNSEERKNSDNLYSSCAAVFVLKNHTIVYRDIYLTESEIENIITSFQHKDIVLSDTAILGDSKMNMYNDMLDEDYNRVISYLQRMQPIYQERKTDGVSLYSITDNHIYASQYENKKEVVYCYDINSSQELVEIMDKYYSEKMKTVLENDYPTNPLSIQICTNDKAGQEYSYKESLETFMKYIKEHYVEEYPKNDYVQIFLSYGDPLTCIYVKLEYTEVLQELINNHAKPKD